jgi:hypothetical protein
VARGCLEDRQPLQFYILSTVCCSSIISSVSAAFCVLTFSIENAVQSVNEAPRRHGARACATRLMLRLFGNS